MEKGIDYFDMKMLIDGEHRYFHKLENVHIGDAYELKRIKVEDHRCIHCLADKGEIHKRMEGIKDSQYPLLAKRCIAEICPNCKKDSNNCECQEGTEVYYAHYQQFKKEGL